MFDVKYDPWVEECDIVHITPSYAQIKTISGKEQTVSLRDLAPLPSSEYGLSQSTPLDEGPLTSDHALIIVPTHPSLLSLALVPLTPHP